MAIELTGKSIVITGASSGIGAATALACADAGMDVVLNARRADRLATVADGVRAAGRRAIVVEGDVTDAGMTGRLLDAAADTDGGLYAVFANAGYGMHKRVVDEDDDEVRRMFEVNFFASRELIDRAARRLVAAERPGHLLMCSSCLSKFALPGHATYSATKAAQNSVCSAMRHELRPHDIRVASVHPITTTTEFFDVSARRSGKRAKASPPDHTPGFLVQTPERVARAIVRSLRRPRPEVWTSLLVRTIAGFMTISPRFYDWTMRRQVQPELDALAQDSD